METSLMVNDYPTPNEEREHTIRLKLYVETSITLYGDNWEDQINELKEHEILQNVNECEIEEYEEM